MNNIRKGSIEELYKSCEHNKNRNIIATFDTGLIFFCKHNQLLNTVIVFLMFSIYNLHRAYRMKRIKNHHYGKYQL